MSKSTNVNSSESAEKVDAPPNYPIPTVGLVNQGCTCYLNSLLQLLFHTSFFRSSVYRMTVDRREETSLIPQALQELFFQMQERKTAPTTKGLTDAFGWDEREVFVQHDIQEMAALLRDCLETQMKATPSEGAINRLFEGFGESVVQTLDGTYSSRRKDTFFDIHLPIEQYKNIAESMMSLIQKDKLVGDNKYRVEEEGKPVVYKDAEKGYQFVRFPPVILFHLKRFEMDLMSPTLDMKKINSAFEFDETLDLREFENPSSEPQPPQDEFDRQSQAIYDLNGVIVHRGGVRSGHYYCFIRHYNCEKNEFSHWLQYDDDTVQVVDKETAVDANFGGFRYTYVNGRNIQVPNTNNAYILSYVRRADRAVVLAPSPTDIISESVKHELQRVMDADERRAAYEKTRRRQIRTVLMTDESIDRHTRDNTFELVNREERLSPNMCKFIDVMKDDRLVDYFAKVSEALGKSEYPPSRLRLWRMHLSADKSKYRSMQPLPTISECRGNETLLSTIVPASQQEKDMLVHSLLYVEVQRENSLSHFRSFCDGNARRLFVKAMAPREGTLSFLGTLDVSCFKGLNSYAEELGNMMRLPTETVLQQIEVVREGGRQGYAEPVPLDVAIMNTRLQNFDIITIQPKESSVVYRKQTAGAVYEEAKRRRYIHVRDIKAPSEVVVSLAVLTTWSYSQLCEAISKAVHQSNPTVPPIEPSHVHLYRNIDFYTPTPAEIPIRCTKGECPTVDSICNLNSYFTDQVFFTVLSQRRYDEEQFDQLRIRILKESGGIEKDVVVVAPVTVLLSELVKAAVAADAVKPQEKSPSSNTPAKDTSAVATVTPPQPANQSTPLHPHYTVQFFFESRAIPTRHPLDVSIGDTTQYLNRHLCIKEWILLTPTSPLPMYDDEDDGESTSGSDAERGSSSRFVRMPCGQGEYVTNISSAIHFGQVGFVTLNDSTTVQEALELTKRALRVPEDATDMLNDPLMIAVERTHPSSDLYSERLLDDHFSSLAYYRFLPEQYSHQVMLYLKSHRSRVFLMLNRKRPKELIGSRYVAANDPKLTLAKKKAPAPATATS